MCADCSSPACFSSWHTSTLTSLVPPSPALARSNLAQNALTGPLPAQWSSLTSLASLDASSNYLSGPLPDAWHSLDSLQELHLANNNLGVGWAGCGLGWLGCGISQRFTRPAAAGWT